MQETKQETLPLISVSTSKIHGTGVYAEQHIKNGSRIIEYIGEKISAKEGTRRDDANPYHTLIFSLDDDWDIDGSVGGNNSRFINHSCGPNAKFVVENGKIWIVAVKDILHGEEITYDYRFGADGSLIKCICGTAACRGFINDPEMK